MRFVATADWQLGMPAAFLPDEARARFAQDRIEVLRRVGDVAREHDADFVVVAGDVFDANQLHRSVVARAFDALREWSVPVYLLPGNHDPLDASSIYRSREFVEARPDHVHVLETPGLQPVAEGVDVVAAPWFTKFPLNDLVADALAEVRPDPDRLRILVGHGGLLGIDRADPALIDRDGLEQALADRRVDVAILGDRHSCTEVAPRLWYPGTPEVTRHRETDPGHVLVVEIDDASHEVAVTPVRVGRWSFLTLEAPLDGPQDLELLETALEEVEDKHLTAVRLVLTGTLTVGQKARLDSLVEQSADRFAAVRVWERHSDLAVRPDDEEFRDLGLTGFAADAVDDLVAQLDTEHAQEARDALGLLYRLVGGPTRGRA
ncbi:DNA repair exonuclease [Aeromicrobium phragmitis]|uniref:Nuclease SbcCD subunit D n=1 Tax=Aeromicrobium phragmitis TaxID=2478914 RepID=A0A3L8PKR9_9ACTN|nr:metallophosphoesterase [Aeromicrobium phragmitis]RLV55840.1 DNA repair exonuclease [Aeromicrobium phragmitis]